jgi:outer membrane biosynthesis protein TonB
VAASRSIFGNGQAPKCTAAPPKKVSISAGVMVGMLIQKTQPVYPPIAKAARVSGTVVLQATISKTGTIEGLSRRSAARPCCTRLPWTRSELGDTGPTC